MKSEAHLIVKVTSKSTHPQGMNLPTNPKILKLFSPSVNASFARGFIGVILYAIFFSKRHYTWSSGFVICQLLASVI